MLVILVDPALAAQQVSSLVSGSPSEAAKQELVNVVFQQMLSLARDYESTRANMKPGPDRTAAMNAIVAKMRALGPTAKKFLPEFTSDKDSPGTRLAGIAVLEMSPDDQYLSWLATRMEVEQPFVFFHAALALPKAHQPLARATFLRQHQPRNSTKEGKNPHQRTNTHTELNGHCLQITTARATSKSPTRSKQPSNIIVV